MKEKAIEQKLVQEVKKQGGICPKFISPGTNGMPDRLVLLPEQHMGFVEVKAPDKKPRELQLYRHEQLRKLGYKVSVLDAPEQITNILAEIKEDQ